MARKKNIDVAAGIDFGSQESEPIDEMPIPADEKIHSREQKNIPATGRSYSKYYTPKPKIGEKGGIIGRPPINEDDRKIQFSVTCTISEKERYHAAAKADGKKFPDFINAAIQEYIKNHNL